MTFITWRVLFSLTFACLLLSSCATQRADRSQLPADINVSKDAGRGGFVVVALRLDSGEELPFVVDTGSPITIFDKSFEPKLGARLGVGTATNFDLNRDMDIYAAPRVYLGDALLKMTGDRVGACDLKDLSVGAGRSIMGILGMDCMEHYCIQFDFKAGKMRFLDGDHLDVGKLGKAYHIEFSTEGQDDGSVRPFISCGTIVGEQGAHLCVDSGCNIDGGLQQDFFQKVVREQKGDLTKKGHARFASCVWDGRTYTNIYVRTWQCDTEAPNLMGLSFLARHLVTYDFPHRTLYLKQTRVGPLPDEDLEAALHATKLKAAKTVLKYCQRLKKRGRLPGWSKDDEIAANTLNFTYHYPDSVSFEFPKKGDSSLYHFEVTRASEESAWELQKAWRTDKDDHMVEEYTVR